MIAGLLLYGLWLQLEIFVDLAVPFLAQTEPNVLSI